MQQKVIGQCYFCQQTKKLCNAHIIPKAFGRDIQETFGNNGPLLEIEINKKPTKIRNHGYFDSFILCKECDQILGKSESYLIEFFRGERVYDYKSIKLALLGILWKASISQRSEWSSIDLGVKFNNKIHMMLEADDSEDELVFPIWLHKFKDVYQKDGQGSLSYLMYYSHENKFRISKSGIRGYVFVFGGYRIIIKVDQRTLPVEIKNFLRLSNANVKNISYTSLGINKDSMEKAFYHVRID